MGKREITAGKNDAGLRLDKFLLKKYNDLPVSLMYKLIRKKDITVNRHRTEEKYILSEGDIIKIYAPDDVFAEKSARRKGDAARLRVAYEDENILIADKESGLLVHSDEGTREDTLIDRITQYLIEKGEFDPDSENSFAPALCNRIDRNTQGLVIAAKNAQALREMNDIVRERAVSKKYLAAVHGCPTPREGELKFFLEKDHEKNMVFVRRSQGANAKTAVTRYSVLEYDHKKDISLLEIELITGRTHQIRASFAHIGCPLVGDGKYAVNKNDREIGYSSQALCAYSLCFDKVSGMPALGYLQGLKVTSAEPEFLRLFRGYHKG